MKSMHNWGTWTAIASLVGTLAAVACDSDTGRPSNAASSDGTDTADPAATGEPAAPYTGESMGGTIPHPDPYAEDPRPMIDAGDITTDKRCCNVTLSIADSVGNESVARVVGDTAPLGGDGLPLTYANGAWSTNACLPLNVRVQYAFYFGNVGVDGGDASVRDLRASSSAPTATTDEGVVINVYAPVADCADIDASAGMSL